MAARLSVRPGAGAPARSLNPQVDEDGLPRYFMGLAGGGSVSDLAQVVSELNTVPVFGIVTTDHSSLSLVLQYMPGSTDLPWDSSICRAGLANEVPTRLSVGARPCTGPSDHGTCHERGTGSSASQGVAARENVWLWLLRLSRDAWSRWWG